MSTSMFMLYVSMYVFRVNWEPGGYRDLAGLLGVRSVCVSVHVCCL